VTGASGGTKRSQRLAGHAEGTLAVWEIHSPSKGTRRGEKAEFLVSLKKKMSKKLSSIFT